MGAVTSDGPADTEPRSMLPGYWQFQARQTVGVSKVTG